MNGPDGKRDFVYSWLFTESLQCSQYFVIILRLFQKVLFQMFSWHLSLKNLDCKSTEWWAAGELTADAQWRRRLYLWSKKRNFHSKLCLEVNSSLGSSTMHISCEEGEQNMNTLKYRNMSCHMCILITTQKRWRKEVPGKEGESEEREFQSSQNHVVSSFNRSARSQFYSLFQQSKWIQQKLFNWLGQINHFSWWK